MFRKILRRIVEDDSIDAEKKVEYIEGVSSIDNEDLLEYLLQSRNGAVPEQPVESPRFIASEEEEDDDDLPEGYVPITDELAAKYGYKVRGQIYVFANRGDIRSIERDRLYVHEGDLDELLSHKMENHDPVEDEEPYEISQWGTRKETAKRLRVSLAKIDQLIRKGMVTTYRVNVRPLPYDLLHAGEVYAVLNGKYPVPKADVSIFEYWLTTSDAAEETGMAEDTIAYLIQKKIIPAVLIGSRRYVNMGDVEVYLDNGS